jgi:transcriptional regulator of aromatic amino acid metabolism
MKGCDTPISVTQLDNIIDGKKWLTRFISKLPKTRQLIFELIISKRIISSAVKKYKIEDEKI